MNFSYHVLRQERCHSRWLHDGRNSRKKVDCDFFEHPPYWEVVCINMYCDSFLGNKDVMTSESTFFRKRNEITIHRKRGVWKFSSQTCVCKQIADPAFNIYPAVCLSRSCFCADNIEFILYAVKMKGKLLKHDAPFLKSHLP